MIIDTTQTTIEREMHEADYMLELLKDLEQDRQRDYMLELLKDLEQDRQRMDMLHGSKLCVTNKPIRVNSSEIACLAAGENDDVNSHG